MTFLVKSYSKILKHSMCNFGVLAKVYLNSCNCNIILFPVSELMISSDL